MSEQSPKPNRKKPPRKAARRGKGGRPKYCGPHAASGLGYVWQDGRAIYFGGAPHGSRESLAAYDAWCRENVEQPEPPPRPESNCTISELVLAYLDHAKAYYANTRNEFGAYRIIGMALHLACGEMQVDDFGPRTLKDFRTAWVAEGQLIGPKIGPKERRPRTRGYVNHQMQRLVRIFKWGVSEELVSPLTLAALEAVEGLKKGRPHGAVDHDPVAAVEVAHVEAVAAVVSPTVAAMIRIHLLTGMRSENVCQMRPEDIDRTAPDVWTYIPAKHKTEWLGKKLFVPLGPQCREILDPFVRRGEGDFLFDPRDAAAWQSEQRAAARKTPASPSHRQRKRTVSRRLRDHYDRGSYRMAVVRGIARANRIRAEWNESHPHAEPLQPIPHWHPHQLRHTRSTLVRRTHGAEAARVYLSHSSLDAAEIYAERDVDLAKQIAMEIG